MAKHSTRKTFDVNSDPRVIAARDAQKKST